MKLPQNLTEEQVVSIAKRVIALVAPTFPFGYYDYDDITQECWILIIKALEKYDGIRPLGNFLHTVLRTRLLNLWRDEYYRTDAPCRACKVANSSGGTPPHDGAYCSKYKKWALLNAAKRDLVAPIKFGDAVQEDTNYQTSHEPYHDIVFDELCDYIDISLPAQLRSSYKRMLAGEKVSAKLRQQVQNSISEILEEYHGKAR